MKKKSLLFTIAFLLASFFTIAQTVIPKGYEKASIHLLNGNLLTGYVKNSIKKNASIIFINETDNKKTTYDGNQIISFSINEDNFICLQGDFFKVISKGKINFIQKQSNAAEVVSYNGTEAIFNSGTEGKIGDYFAYENKKLQILNKKTIASFIETTLISNALAVEKAKLINGDMAKLAEAINIFNSKETL
jgi:hypothetical protein